jgi:hypothetical protein
MAAFFDNGDVKRNNIRVIVDNQHIFTHGQSSLDFLLKDSLAFAFSCVIRQRACEPHHAIKPVSAPPFTDKITF